MSTFKLMSLLVAVFAASAVAQQAGKSLGPTYTLLKSITITPNNYMDRQERNFSTMGVFSNTSYFEWESFDGWYNNPAHPEWGGADMPLERKTPVVYPDGSYEMIPEQPRGNVLLISNATQHGVSGRGSVRRTAFFTFFGQQVVEEMLDAQRPGCIPEYENIKIPKCHALYDPDCRSDRVIPFLRNRYDFRTGYSPNNPRMQLNEITPWMDGGLVYGPFKAWTDAIRRFKKGELASQGRNGDVTEAGQDSDIAELFPIRNDIGLPLANPPPPANSTQSQRLFPVNRFWAIGNPRGDENAFLLSMGILWFRVHQYWARQLYGARKSFSHHLAEEDEWLFNRARQFTIATYQHIVFDFWLPQFLPRKYGGIGIEEYPYNNTPGYSSFAPNTGYNPAINPQVPHIFQSAAMRWGHTVVTPGIWRRELTDDSNSCRFGSPLSPTYSHTNSFLSRTSNQEFSSWRDITDEYLFRPRREPDLLQNLDRRAVYQMLQSTNETLINSTQYETNAPLDHFAIRTCNSFWNPQVTMAATNVDAFYLGMSSQATEREDTIITPDLRGKVFGPLDYSRRDLMAINMQRARDHGLPDYNTARMAFGLETYSKFEEINPLYGTDPTVTENIEGLRAVYNDDIARCDIWACGLAETIPSDDPTLSQLSGPGELFTEVLFDHFMRVRHGDRFWYENSNNGLFSPEEVEAIKSLNVRDLIIQTTHIRREDISENPFLFENAVCPQPFQLSELYMDDCTALEGFDYYIQSDYEIPILWSFVFLYVFLVIGVMLVMAAYNQHVRAQILSAGKRPPKEKKIEGDAVETQDGELIIFTELRAGLKSESRQVNFKFGPGKRIVIYFGGQEFRVIDLRFQTKVAIQRPFDNTYNVVIKIPHEYDVIIKCYSPLDRTVFIDKLQNYLNTIGVGNEVEEPQNSRMMGMVYTKRDRQATLENFFKSVFREGASTSGSGLGEIKHDILECELTKQEFADAMSLKPDSLFVDQMFQLIDQDGNGFVSFREFLDMFVIFAKGSPDDKIELMFNMYDVDKSGSMNKIEFKKMLKAMMEMVNASVTPDQMDQLIDSMFASAGFQNKTELTIDDFKVLLRDHKEELSNAHLNVKGYDLPEVEVEAKSKDGEEVPSRYRARETAPARARRTIIKAYGKGGPKKPGSKDDAAEQNLTSSTIEIPTISKSAPKTSIGRQYSIFVRYIENQKLQIFYFVLFMLVTAGIFVERGYYYAVERESGGLRRIAGFGVTITRGAASGMMWAYSVLLLTMARNLITFLRETVFNYYIPFDSYIEAHKVIALTALFFTIMHAIGHGINFYHIATQTANDLTCIFREVYHRTHVLPKFSYWLFLTMTGFAGFMASVITVIIFVFATQYARRYTYRAFWVTHHWYVIFYILTFLHGSGRLVQDPLFGNFFLGPGLVYALDLLVSVGRRTVELSVVRADILPSQVIGIYFKRPITFDYKAGQWVKIASAAQNPGEFHSFTISSAPHEENLSLHIRAVGPWTYNFRENYSPANLQGKPYPKVFIDGPFGEGHQDWFRYEVAVLVGGGIGVTPFASILKELVHRFNIGARVECRKVFFIWVTRTQKQYEWFTEIIREAEEKDKNNQLEVHIFVTQFFDKFDLRTTMLYICERHFQRLSGKSLFTGLRAVTHFGRPDFNQFFDNLQEEYLLLSKIGVFSCGPPGMTNGVEAACAATNRFEGPAFHHHYENF